MLFPINLDFWHVVVMMLIVIRVKKLHHKAIQLNEFLKRSLFNSFVFLGAWRRHEKWPRKIVESLSKEEELGRTTWNQLLWKSIKGGSMGQLWKKEERNIHEARCERREGRRRQRERGHFWGLFLVLPEKANIVMQ